jgi:hypothetical protein
LTCIFHTRSSARSSSNHNRLVYSPPSDMVRDRGGGMAGGEWVLNGRLGGWWVTRGVRVTPSQQLRAPPGFRGTAQHSSAAAAPELVMHPHTFHCRPAASCLLGMHVSPSLGGALVADRAHGGGITACWTTPRRMHNAPGRPSSHCQPLQLKGVSNAGGGAGLRRVGAEALAQAASTRHA